MALNTIKALLTKLFAAGRNFALKHVLPPHVVISYYRSKGMQIGQNCRIHPFLPVEEAHLIRIGDDVTISTGAMLILHDGATRVIRKKYPGSGRPGHIFIKDNCFIGAHALVLPGVTIGPNSIVGAGAVVVHDVPPDSVVAGVPARVIKTLEQYERDLMADPLFRPWKSKEEIKRVVWGQDVHDPG